MSSKELIKKIILRLFKLKILIFIGGILFCILFYLYAKKQPAFYSVKSTIFPLTPGNDKGSATSKITELLGGNSGTKSITEEASVNIEEVGKSKKTREAVVKESLVEFNNLTIAEILINQYNKNKSFFALPIEKSTNIEDLYRNGSSLLKEMYVVKFNKNNLLEITFTNTDEKLIPAISYKLIEKISLFYKELKIEKAILDLDFATKKLDSLEIELKEINAQRIQLNNTTLFIPTGRLKYSVPKEDLDNKLARIISLRNNASSTKDDATYRLDKITPVIQVLDKPTPPYDKVKPSGIIYGAIGFIVGCILFAFIFISGILIKFANQQVKETISKQLS